MVDELPCCSNVSAAIGADGDTCAHPTTSLAPPLPLCPAGVLGLQHWGLLPAAVAADPVLLLVLLAGSVMPTAQNLIVLLQLSQRTQPLAPVLARMLLKLYAYSILPVSLWISGWATWLGVQVVG